VTLKMLDCFCGMGGVSDGFAAEGFDVTGIDIVDAKGMLGYKHKFIQADLTKLNGADFQGYDVIHGSPPCRDVCRMAFVGHGSVRKDGVKFAWKDPPNPERGVRTVRAYLKFVEVAKPKFWILENSPFLERHLGMKPNQVSHLQRTMVRAFWGDYPLFLLTTTKGKQIKIDVQGKYRSWQRAKIPLAVSKAFAKACREALEPQLRVINSSENSEASK
jgi:hypothetical protein